MPQRGHHSMAARRCVFEYSTHPTYSKTHLLGRVRRVLEDAPGGNKIAATMQTSKCPSAGTIAWRRGGASSITRRTLLTRRRTYSVGCVEYSKTHRAVTRSRPRCKRVNAPARAP